MRYYISLMGIKIKPFLKWAGGKSSISKIITELFPVEFDDYYEPFCGGSSIFFSMDFTKHNKIFLSDLNSELINSYKEVRDNCLNLIEKLEIHSDNHNEEYYLKIRSEDFVDPLDRAARFIYLNRSCFNGLYRVNKSGKFNVPIGRPNHLICDKDNLLLVSEKLRGVNLESKSFDKISPNSGDLIYCDPPYHGTFDSYDKGGFDESCHILLRDCAKKWKDAGAIVFLSNSDDEFVNDLYDGFNKFVLSSNRSVGGGKQSRKRVSELLVW